MPRNSLASTSASFQTAAAVVTGASSGIGQAIAVGLAEAGIRQVVVHYRQNRAGAEQTAEQLKQAGCEACLIAADLSLASDRQRLVEEAWRQLGTITTWINNAGADVLTGEQAEATFETKLQRLWEVDVKGTIALSRQVAPRLRDQHLPLPPSMLFLGWDQAPRGMEGDAGQMFAPIKAAVMAFAASLAQEFAPEVRVNTVAPGWIQTAWGQSTSEYWDRRAKQQALMQRWGTPQDVAAAAVYLSNPAHSFLTAQTIEVNGGWNRKHS